jgi:uncharacterized protein YneF (UPF0154 family)
MELVKRVSYIITAFMVTGLLAGCFSYHREVQHTTAENPPASSTTSTTTTNDNGTIERQSTTTYSNP